MSFVEPDLPLESRGGRGRSESVSVETKSSSRSAAKGAPRSWLVIALLLGLLVGAAVAAVIALLWLAPRTRLYFLWVDSNGNLWFPSSFCGVGSGCDTNALAIYPVQSDVVALPWKSGAAPPLPQLADAVWEWDNGRLIHYATQRYLSYTSLFVDPAKTAVALQLTDHRGSATLWKFVTSSTGHASIRSVDGKATLATASKLYAPMAVALLSPASAVGASSLFSMVPWEIAARP